MKIAPHRPYAKLQPQLEVPHTKAEWTKRFQLPETKTEAPDKSTPKELWFRKKALRAKKPERLESYAELAKFKKASLAAGRPELMKAKPQLSAPVYPRPLPQPEEAPEQTATISGAILFKHMHYRPERLKVFDAFQNWVGDKGVNSKTDGPLTREAFEKFLANDEKAEEVAKKHQKFFDYLFDHAEQVGPKIFQLQVDHYL